MQTDINLPSLMPDEDKTFRGSLVLDFRKLRHHVKTIYKKIFNLSRNMSKFVAWQVVSLMKIGFLQSQNLLLYILQQLSSTNKCFCYATSWSHKVKNVKPWSETCNEIILHDWQVEGFCISHFVTLKETNLGMTWVSFDP